MGMEEAFRSAPGTPSPPKAEEPKMDEPPGAEAAKPMQPDKAPEMATPETPEAVTNGMFRSVRKFMRDVGEANRNAKDQLRGKTALQSVLSGIGVTSFGVLGELYANTILKSVLGRFGTIGGKEITDREGIQKFLEERVKNTHIQRSLIEIIQDLAIVGGYNVLSKFTSEALPLVPSQFIGAAITYNLAEGGIRAVGGKLRRSAGAADGNEAAGANAAPEARIPKAIRAVTDKVNLVTLFGVSLIYNGIREFRKAFRDVKEGKPATLPPVRVYTGYGASGRHQREQEQKS